MNWLEWMNIYLLIAVIGVTVSLYFTYSHRRSPWARTYFLMGIFIGFYLIGYILEFNSSNLQNMIFYNLIQYIGIPFYPLFWLYLGIQMNYKITMNPWRWLAFLSPGIFIFLLRLTNPLHNWYYKGFNVVEFNGRYILLLDRSGAFYLYMVITTVVFVIGNALVIKYIYKNKEKYGAMSALVFFATLLPWAAMIANSVGWPIEGVDLPILVLPLTIMIMIFVLLRFDFLSVEKIASSQLFYLSTEGYLITDQYENLMDMNDSAKQLLGLTHKQIIAMSIKEIFEEHLDVSKFDMPMGQMMILHGGKYIEVTKMPLKNKGVIVGYLYVLDDVTDVQKLSENLMVAQRKYDQLIQSFEDVYFQTDLYGTVLSVSDSIFAFLGYRSNEVMGTVVTNYYANPEDRELFISKLLKEGVIQDFPAKFVRKSGEVISCSISASISDNLHQEGKVISGSMKDITQVVELSSQVESVERLMQLTLASVSDAICTFNSNQTLQLANPTAQQWFSFQSVSHARFADVIIYDAQKNRIYFEDLMNIATNQKPQFEGYIQIKKKWVDVLMTASLLMFQEEVFGVVLVIKDISVIKDEQRRIEYLSDHDALTGCMNRRAFEKAKLEVSEDRYLPLAVVVADVNGLKMTNDAFGHHKGDQLLITAAQFLDQWTEHPHPVYRIGGDEFVLFWPNTSLFMAQEKLQQMKQACKQVELSTGALSISLGLSVKGQSTMDIDTVFRQAEDDMYQQKIYESSATKGNLIQTILDTLNQKNPEEFEHSERVASLAEEVAKQMGLSVFQINEVKSASFLHDIGKIGIEDDLLNRKGNLSESELIEVRRHTEIGYRILSAHPQLKEVAEAVYSHHERYDGKGYPRKLSKEDIPLAARIIAVVDAFDSMTRRTHNNRMMSLEEAVNELYHYQGTQFDPKVVNALVALIQDSTIG